MKRNSISILQSAFLVPLLIATASAQSSNQSAAPVSYSSASQLNELLTKLEQTSQATQIDLAGTRIDRWKTDSNTKRQTQANLESIQRNLKTALPEIIGQLKNSPENLAASFKLYRNLDALYDVMGTVVESAGAFGTKDEFQSLNNDFNTIEAARHGLGERMQALAESKDTEMTQLRTQLHNAQAAVPATPPKKVIVDDTEPVKKPAVKKKPGAKTTKPGTAAPSSTSPASPAPAKPQ